MSYATPAQLKERYDVRTIGDLAQDAGARVSSANILTDANVQACLNDASGDIDSALLVGGRYLPSDLAAILASSDTAVAYSIFKLVRICCDIAMGYLIDRRLLQATEEFTERIFKRANDHILALRRGEEMFYVQVNVDATVPVVDGPTTQTLEELHTIRRQTLHFFPDTVLPHNR